MFIINLTKFGYFFFILIKTSVKFFYWIFFYYLLIFVESSNYFLLYFLKNQIPFYSSKKISSCRFMIFYVIFCLGIYHKLKMGFKMTSIEKEISGPALIYFLFDCRRNFNFLVLFNYFFIIKTIMFLRRLLKEFSRIYVLYIEKTYKFVFELNPSALSE